MVFVDMARTFGEALADARAKAGLTQEQFAAKLKIKRQSGVSGMEQRRYAPRPKTVEKLARALGCSPADLLEDVETPYDYLFEPQQEESRARAPSGRAPVKRHRAG